MYRKSLLKKLFVAVLFTAATAGSAFPQQTAWPNRPIRIIIGFVAGGVSDVMMRALAPELQKSLGQPVIVENRPGAAGITAADYVAKSPPDGYTLYMAPNTHLVNQAIHPKLPFDVIKDFTPITLLTSTVNLLVVNAQSPITDLSAYLHAAKEKPGQVSYATSGVGSTVHLAGEMLAFQAGVKLNHIPYKGANQSIEAVVGGHVTSSVSAIASSRPFIEAGRVRVLATMGDKRSEFLPSTPTFSELGYPLMLSDTWLGIIGPANIPPEIAARLNLEFLKLLQRPDIKEKIARLGSEVVGLGLQDFGAREAKELAAYIQIVKASNIKAE